MLYSAYYLTIHLRSYSQRLHAFSAAASSGTTRSQSFRHASIDLLLQSSEARNRSLIPKSDSKSKGESAVAQLQQIAVLTKMGESWGPWHGCSPVSPGCANCYAVMRQMPAYGYKNPQKVERGTKPTFNKPLHWKQNDPQIIFVCPWGDFFIDDPVANNARPDAWNIMRTTPWHTYRITTKRPENIHRFLPSDWPLKNVWLGVSAEDQKWADLRMNILRQIPMASSAIRWISAEPLLGPIRFAGQSALTGFGWVIAGGESSTAKHPPRLVNPQLFLDLAAQCKTAGVPYLLKQLGGTTKCKCHKAYGCRAIPPGPNGQTFDQFP